LEKHLLRPKATELMGLVLCGGESRRMGRDKGLMLHDGMPRALYVGQKPMRWMPVYYSIRKAQVEAYAAVLPTERLIIDVMGIGGPLNGLLSVHRRFPAADILLVACDMLDLDEATLERLMAAREAGDADFYAYGDERLWQPFGCIYTSRGLGKAPGHSSLQSLLRSGRTQGLPIVDAAAFNNYNTL
jgi:molybdopterin-guanine dinucleotide biosynthesis protein A